MLQMDGIFFRQPLLIIALMLFVLLLAGEQAGRWLRQRVGSKNTLEGAELLDFGYILTSVFGLLGLLIAFTFSLALDRYEARRDLVVQEANAIGTAHIRATFASEPVRSELRVSLESYAANRLDYGRANQVQKLAISHKSSEMRSRLAEIGVAASLTVPLAPLAPSLISSINNVIDVGSEREAINLAHVPSSVILLLFSYAGVSALVLGFSQPLTGRSNRVANGLLYILLALAMIMILDLDRPATGTIIISQAPMAELIGSFSH